MEDRRLNIGSEVPLELRVYITRPNEFFQIFDDGRTSAMSHKSAFLDQRKTANPSILRRESGLLTVNSNAILANAAFGLLQWAQYGDVPAFDPPVEQKQVGPRNDIPIFAADTDRIDSKVEGDDKCEDETNPDEIRPSEEESETPEWAKPIFGSVESKETSLLSSDTVLLPEEADPKMLRNQGVALRPYQRQALHFMMQREKAACSNPDNCADSYFSRKEALRNEMDFLHELSASCIRHRDRSGSSTLSCDKGRGVTHVSCEVGPVQVSDELAAQSTTLDGVLDPVAHPLWDRRFLWRTNEYSTDSVGTSATVHLFYVNELLGSASKYPPNPPQQAVGGILADAMGLGKTVMLLSLIAKVKETEEGIGVNPTIEGGERKCGLSTTLIVAPLSLLSQWKDEVDTKTCLASYVYYDDTKRSNVDFGAYDVVLTTCTF